MSTETSTAPLATAGGPSALWMCFPVVAATLDEALRVAITVAVQRLRDMRVCPDPPHLFVDILAKVGYVEDATPLLR